MSTQAYDVYKENGPTKYMGIPAIDESLKSSNVEVLIFLWRCEIWKACDSDKNHAKHNVDHEFSHKK